MLLAARVVLGVALGGFWSMAAALALRLVPDTLFARAMALILSGVSVATVCAAPIGAWMGATWGWRSAFVAAGAVGLVAFAAQAWALPALPPRDKPDLRVLGELLRRPRVRVALLSVVLVISGHFAGFTYVRPLMEQVARLSVGAVSGVLLGYGVGGFFGNLAGGWIAERSERRAIVAGGALIVLLALQPAAGGRSPVVTAVAVALGASRSARSRSASRRGSLAPRPTTPKARAACWSPRSRSPSPSARSAAACSWTASARSAARLSRSRRSCPAP